MAQYPVEMILLKQWAEHMASSIWLMDAAGDLVYYNEPAEELLGLRFNEAGAIHADHLADLFHTTDLDGGPVDTADLPVVIALTKSQPAHAAVRIRDRTGQARDLEITALPIEAAGGRHLGAIAIFWEIGK